jgi:hypothetical protein
MRRGLTAALLASALLPALGPVLADDGDGPVLSDPRFVLGPSPQSQELRVEVGGGWPVEQVIVFHRTPPARRYSVHEMEGEGVGTFRVVLPRPAPPAEAMEFHVAAADVRGAIGNLGSPEDPITVTLARSPETPPETIALVASLSAAAFLTFLLILVGSLRRRRKARVWSDQRYWLRMLGRLSSKTGPALTARIKQMSRRPLIHHRYGPVRWSRRELNRKIEEVRRLKRAAVARAESG